MEFIRPVASCFRVTRQYGEYGRHFHNHVDPLTRKWVDGQICYKCSEKISCKCVKPTPIGQHRGVDFACPIGTPVLAMTDGMIIRAGSESYESSHHLGKRIIQLVSTIGYDSWFITYRNIGEFIEIPSGRRINAGDRIGYTGYEGDGSPFLHVEMKDIRGQWHPLPIQPEVCKGACKP